MHGATTSRALVARLLDAMKAGARPVKPKDLEIIGREHLLNRFIAADPEAASLPGERLRA